MDGSAALHHPWWLQIAPLPTYVCGPWPHGVMVPYAPGLSWCVGCGWKIGVRAMAEWLAEQRIALDDLSPGETMHALNEAVEQGVGAKS